MAAGTYEPDEQDQSEVFDEDNTDDVDSGPHQHEMKTFEELPDVFDVTRRAGDGRDDPAMDEEEFTDGAIDEDDAEEDAYALGDESLNVSAESEGLDEVAAASDEVELTYEGDIDNRRGAQASAAHFESRRELSTDDLEELGYVDRDNDSED